MCSFLFWRFLSKVVNNQLTILIRFRPCTIWKCQGLVTDLRDQRLVNRGHQISNLSVTVADGPVAVTMAFKYLTPARSTTVTGRQSQVVF